MGRLRGWSGNLGRRATLAVSVLLFVATSGSQVTAAPVAPGLGGVSLASITPAVSAMAAGGDYPGSYSTTCAIVAGGSVRCWGLTPGGLHAPSDRSPVPILVAGITNARVLAVGSAYVCAALTSGSVRCWGLNQWGQLGDGTKTTRSSPVTVRGISTAVAIAAGRYHTCAVLSDGAVDCWGLNQYGQLGDGSTTTRASPVRVQEITTAITISAGRDHTCASLADRTVRCWGLNVSGQLGDGTTTDRHVPVDVAGISTATAVALGQLDSCALVTAGSVACWGDDLHGQLGDAGSYGSASPVTVPDITTAVAIAGGGWHACAMLADGRVRCWGDNAQGQRGGTSSDGSPVVASGIDTATGIALGPSHSCALLGDGGVRCWGSNSVGELGNGAIDLDPHEVPSDVAFDTVAPRTGAPSASPAIGPLPSGSSLRLKLSWSVSDSGGSGIARYILARSRDGGRTWTTLSSTSAARTAIVVVPSSGTVRFRVRAFDRAGNGGPWATGPTIAPRLTQEADPLVQFSGGWGRSSRSAYSGGAARFASRAGASASYRFVGRSIALVTSKSPTRGQIRISIDGVPVAMVDLHAASTTYRAAVWQMTWPSVATRTVSAEVVGTPGRPRVDFDAFVKLR